MKNRRVGGWWSKQPLPYQSGVVGLLNGHWLPAEWVEAWCCRRPLSRPTTRLEEVKVAGDNSRCHLPIQIVVYSIFFLNFRKQKMWKLDGNRRLEEVYMLPATRIRSSTRRDINLVML